MWWWLVLLSVCHRLPSSDKGDSASSHSDCLHWYEDPAHRLVAVPMKTCTTGDRLLLPRPSLWLLSWFTLLLLLRTWSRTSQSSLTNWGPTAPQEPSGSVAPDCDCWGTQPHRLSKCWVVALLGTDDCYGCSLCTATPSLKDWATPGFFTCSCGYYFNISWLNMRACVHVRVCVYSSYRFWFSGKL